MKRESILSLVAQGRITAGEAERLLVAWNAGREELWTIGVCAAACVAESLPAIANLAHQLLPGGVPGLLHAASAVTNYWMGGVL